MSALDDVLEEPTADEFPLVDESLGPEPPWPPEGAVLVLSGTVLGEPKPAGSKWSGVATKKDKKTGKRVPIRRKDGKGWVTFTKDSSGAKGDDWRGDIRRKILDAWVERAPLDEPLAISIVFYGGRTKGHYGTGRNAGVLKESAPRFPHSSSLPDGTKLLRAFEDALSKLVWKDDRRFVDHRISRRFGRPRAEYRVYRLPEKVGPPTDFLMIGGPASQEALSL